MNLNLKWFLDNNKKELSSQHVHVSKRKWCTDSLLIAGMRPALKIAEERWAWRCYHHSHCSQTFQNLPVLEQQQWLTVKKCKSHLNRKCFVLSGTNSIVTNHSSAAKRWFLCEENTIFRWQLSCKLMENCNISRKMAGGESAIAGQHNTTYEDSELRWGQRLGGVSRNK